MINFLPGIIVAQTKGANTLVRWAKSGFKDYNPGSFKDSIASAMNIQNPVSFPRIKELRKKFRIEFLTRPKAISKKQETCLWGRALIFVLKLPWRWTRF